MANAPTIFIPAEEVRAAVAADATAASQPVPANQPQSGGDSRLEAILQKKSAGEKLSAKDRGYLGAVKRRGAPKTVAAPASENLLLDVPANTENELFKDEQPATEESFAGVATAVNPVQLRNTANSLLNSMDTVTKFYIGYEAKQAGGDKQTVEEYKAAVALQPENRDLMLDGSEPVVLMLCKLFKCSPERLETVLKSSGFIGGLCAHSLAVVTVAKSIRESGRERAAAKAAEAANP